MSRISINYGFHNNNYGFLPLTFVFPRPHLFEAENFELPHGMFHQNPIQNTPLPGLLPICTPTTAGTAAAPTAEPDMSFTAMMEGVSRMPAYPLTRSGARSK